MLPNFVIIGAQKSATTFIQKALGYHSQVFMAPGEQPFFEDPDYGRGDLAAFERKFEPGRGKRAIGMKRPNYLGRPEVPERLARHLPRARLIAVLRDPIDRAVSAYYHNVRLGFAPVVHVNTGMRDLLDGRWTLRYPRTPEILEFGFYYAQLSRYLKYFDTSQLCVLLHDEVVADLAGSLKQIMAFLEIDEEDVASKVNGHPQAVTYVLPRLRVLTLQNRIAFSYIENGTRNAPRQLGTLGQATIKAIQLFDRYVLARLFGNAKPQLSAELRQELAARYRDDIIRLEALLGRSLRHWKVFADDQPPAPSLSHRGLRST